MIPDLISQLLAIALFWAGLVGVLCLLEFARVFIEEFRSSNSERRAAERISRSKIIGVRERT